MGTGTGMRGVEKKRKDVGASVCLSAVNRKQQSPVDPLEGNDDESESEKRRKRKETEPEKSSKRRSMSLNEDERERGVVGDGERATKACLFRCLAVQRAQKLQWTMPGQMYQL